MIPRPAGLCLALSLIEGSLPADEVVLKDGSRVIGEVLTMENNVLKVKTLFAKEIEIEWAQVTSLSTDKPISIHQGKSVYDGRAAAGQAGQIAVTVQGLLAPLAVDLASISSINPPLKPAMTFKGYAQVGITITNGNTQTKSAAASGEFEARADLQRFTLRGATNYAEDEDGLIARNSRGSIKYDYFFIPKRLYFFTSALFEGDTFQDLKLRTALSTGPGWQIVDANDYPEPWLKDVQVYAEAGVAYFDEDFKNSPDNNYVSARWAFKVDWPLSEKRIILFHFHEGYPGLERADDLYLLTEQGVRFTILKGLFASLQVNWRWDNTPASGRERSDTSYLFNLGYGFEKSA